MKHLLVPLCLLVSASSLLAFDDGGDGAVIPSYQELIREGYGPRYPHRDEFEGYLMRPQPLRQAPKPTQAFYGPGYIVYYGYITVPVYEPGSNYSFGYPLEFYRKLMPASVTDVNMDRYAVAVGTQKNYHRAAVQGESRHKPAVTSVVPASAPAQANPDAATTGTTPGRKAIPTPAAGNKAGH